MSSKSTASRFAIGRRGSSSCCAIRNAGARIGDIIAESARYNIGSIQRTINTPLMALLFLDAGNQHRFRFKHVEKPTPVFTDARDTRDQRDAGVPRRHRNVDGRVPGARAATPSSGRPDGDDRRAQGRFWIDPSNGSVLISELIVDGGGVHRDRDGQLPIGAADGIPGAGRDARVLHPVPASASPGTPNTASSGRSRNKLGCIRC